MIVTIFFIMNLLGWINCDRTKFMRIDIDQLIENLISRYAY